MRFAVFAFAVAALVLSGHDAHCQIPAATPDQLKAATDFEVASIKEHRGPRPDGVRLGMSMNPVGRFQASYATLRQLILVAYDLKGYQIIGGPDWIDGARFDIVATAPEDFDIGHTRAMLRRLLEGRFRLIVKETRRPLEVYALEVADRGRLAKALRTPSPNCDDLAPIERASQPRGRSGVVECTG